MEFGSNLDTPMAPKGFGRAGFKMSSCPSCLPDFAFRNQVTGGTAGATRWSKPEWAMTANRRELAVERAAKKDAVVALNEVFKTTNVAIVAHYSGLTVAQMQKLRSQMRQAGASVKVSKNRLAKIALEGTDVAAIGSLLKGPTVIATSKDPVAAPKVAIEFAKANEKFVILGGSMGKTVLNVDGVKALASLPSLDELRAKIVGLIVAPATKLAQLSNAPAAKLARVIQAHASKGEAA
jgi:large subunit ribosomal protein L10